MSEMRLRKSLFGKPEGKRPAGRGRRKWKGNKVVLKNYSVTVWIALISHKTVSNGKVLSP